MDAIYHKHIDVADRKRSVVIPFFFTFRLFIPRRDVTEESTIAEILQN